MAAKKAAPKAKIEPAMTNVPKPETKRIDWRDPDFKPAADDQSLDAQMWRLGRR